MKNLDSLRLLRWILVRVCWSARRGSLNKLIEQRKDRLRKLEELKRAEKHLCAVLSEKAERRIANVDPGTPLHCCAVNGSRVPSWRSQKFTPILTICTITAKKVMMNDKAYSVYIRQQWEEYNARKDVEKQQQEERKQQTLEEMMYGSHPAAAVCRNRQVVTPFMSSRSAILRSKQAKLDEAASKPDETRTAANLRTSTIRNQRTMNRRLQMSASDRRPLTQNSSSSSSSSSSIVSC